MLLYENVTKQLLVKAIMTLSLVLDISLSTLLQSPRKR